MSAEAADVSASIARPSVQVSHAVDSKPAPTTSPADRLKAFLSAPEKDPTQPKADSADEADAESVNVAPVDRPVPESEAQAPETDQADAAVDEQSGDAQSEDWKPSDLSELLTAAFGEESEKGLDLPVKVKIDGKEGTATLRDLVKSYQLDGHINQKLASLDTDRKTFESKVQEFQSERADKLLRLDAGIQTLERSLLGEFQSVDWSKLASEDPVAYNAKFVDFQQRNAHLNDIGLQIAEERAQQHQQQTQAYAERLAEERKLMVAKVPEWSNETARQKDRAEIGTYLESVGISKQEFEAIDDHRYALVARDAWKWAQLQKSKPAVLNKVKAAPKLLRPGTQQSKDASASVAVQKDHARLRQTGRVADAAKLLRGRLFG